MRSEYPNRPSAEVNPDHEPIGHFTGRCGQCGSNDLWDDNLAYGCRNCGAIRGPDNSPPPILVRCS
jgi:hypothetical protein